jgi:hypothetical protein
LNTITLLIGVAMNPPQARSIPATDVQVWRAGRIIDDHEDGGEIHPE